MGACAQLDRKQKTCMKPIVKFNDWKNYIVSLDFNEGFFLT